MNENRSDNIDKLFKDALPSKEEPSKNVWNQIERGLDKYDNQYYISRSRLFFALSACLFVLLFSFGILAFIHYKNDHMKDLHANGETLIVSAQKFEHISRSPSSVDPIHPLAEKRVIKRKDLNELNLNIARRRQLDPKEDNSLEVEGHLSKNPARSSEEKEFRDMVLIHANKGNLEPVRLKILSLEWYSNQRLFGQVQAVKEIANSKRDSRFAHFSITGYFSQEFSGYNLSDNDAASPYDQEIEQKERDVFSASGGLLLNYMLKKRVMIQSGLSYSWSRSSMDPSECFAVANNNGNIQYKISTISGYGYLPSSASVAPNLGDSALTDKSFSKLAYLTIPLIGSYVFKLSRFTILAGAGVCFNFLTSARLESKIEGPSPNGGESVVTMYGLKKVNYGILVKGELQYPINSNWWIHLIPYFKNALSPINMHNALSTYPYNFGIGLGVSHGF
jgi:hypothetical protein